MPGVFQDVIDLPHPAVDYAWSVEFPSNLPEPANTVLNENAVRSADDHGPGDIAIFAKSVSFTPYSAQSEESQSGINYATGRDLPEITITFYEKRDWGIHKIIQAWSEAVFTANTRYSQRGRAIVRPPGSYMSSVRFRLLDSRAEAGESATEASYLAQRVWPSSLEEFDFDYENDGIETFQTTFQAHAVKLEERA